jgi:hypothetical protein
VLPKNQRVGINHMRKLLLFAGLIIFISSCSTVIAPSYTSVSKIYKLKKGMKLKEVSFTLESTPYDMYINYLNGEKVVEYKYVHQFVKNAGAPTATVNEDRLNQGANRFKNESDLMVVFDQKTGDMLYYYTSTGLSRSNASLNQMNQILNNK